MYWQNQDDHVALRSSTGHVDDDGSLGLISMKQDKKDPGEYRYFLRIDGSQSRSSPSRTSV